MPACRVPVQTVDDSSSSVLAAAATDAVHAVAAGCDISTLADVTEQPCSTSHNEVSSGAAGSTSCTLLFVWLS